ncbi:MAG: hypothetical protein IPJ69_05730 [Deltaproteobacteria bacterium]|nr:MAG: hypothetical protein IPJ69_05730 [Deltaproteobacteria bacterium]
MLVGTQTSLTPLDTAALFSAMTTMASFYAEAASRGAYAPLALTNQQRALLTDVSPTLGCEHYWKTISNPKTPDRSDLARASMHMAEGLRHFLNLKQFENSPTLKKGDWVFVAGTGLCQVIGKEERSIRGQACTFFIFEYTWPTSNTKIRVIKSEDKISSSIRSIAPLEEYQRAVEILNTPRDHSEQKNHHQFHTTCQRLYQQGSPEVLALLLSHLAPHVRKKTDEISESIILFRNVLATLSGEIALASHRSHSDVIHEILTKLNLTTHSLIKITSHVTPTTEDSEILWTYGVKVTASVVEAETPDTKTETPLPLKEETPSETVEEALMQVSLKPYIRVEDILPGDTHTSLEEYLKCFRWKEIHRENFKKLVGVSVETAQNWGKGTHQPERSAYILKLFRFLVTQHLRDDEKVPDLLDLWMLAYPKEGKLLKNTIQRDRCIIPMKEVVLGLPLSELTYDNALEKVTAEVHPKLLVDGVRSTTGIPAISPQTVTKHLKGRVAASASMGGTKGNMGVIFGPEAEAFFMLDHLTLGIPLAVGDFQPRDPALGRLTRYTICLANAEDDWELYYKFRDQPDRETFPFLYLHQAPDPFHILMNELEARVSLLEKIQQSTPGLSFTTSKVAGSPPKPDLLKRRLEAFRSSHAAMQKQYAAYEANPTALPMNTLTEIRNHYRRLMRFARSLRETWAVSGQLQMTPKEVVAFELAPETQEGLLPHQACLRDKKMILPSQAFEVWHQVTSQTAGEKPSTDRFLKLHLTFIKLVERGVVTEEDIPSLAKNILGTPCELDVVAYKQFRTLSETHDRRASLDAGYSEVHDIYDQIGYERKKKLAAKTKPNQPLIDVVRDYLGLDDDNTQTIANILETYLEDHADAKTIFDLQKLTAAISKNKVSPTSAAASVPLLNTVLGYLKMKTQEHLELAPPPLPEKPERPVEDLITFPRILEENHLVASRASRLAHYHAATSTDFTPEQKEEVTAILSLVASRFKRSIIQSKKIDDNEVKMALKLIRDERSLFLGPSIDLDLSKLIKIIFSFLKFLRELFERERKTLQSTDKGAIARATDNLLFHCVAGTQTTTLEDICLAEADTSKSRHQILVSDGVATLSTFMAHRQQHIAQEIKDFHDFFEVVIREDLTGVHQGNAEDFLRRNHVLEGSLESFLIPIETRGLLYLENLEAVYSIRKVLNHFIQSLPAAPKPTDDKLDNNPSTPPKNPPAPHRQSEPIVVTTKISDTEKRILKWIEFLGDDEDAATIVRTYPELHSFATWDKGAHAMRGFAAAAERERPYNPSSENLRQLLLQKDMSGNEAHLHFKRKELVQKLKAKERVLWARILREALKDPRSPALAIACTTHHVDAFQRSDRLYQIRERCFDEDGNFKPGWVIEFTKLYGKYRREIADRIYHYQHCGRHSPAINNDAFFNEPITVPAPYRIPKELEMFEDVQRRNFKHVDGAIIDTYAYYRSLKEKDDFFWPLHYLMICPDIEDLQGVVSKIFSHLSDTHLKGKLGKISERFPNIPKEEEIVGTPSGERWRQNIIGYYLEIKSQSGSLLSGEKVPVFDPSNPTGAQGLFKLERRKTP